MKKYKTESIHNLAFVGHSGAGKTSTIEAIAYKTGAIDRLGKVEDKNTVSDFDKEEQNRGMTIGMSLVPVEYKDRKINLIDSPGYFDFEGEVLGALRAAEASLIVMDASNGIEVGTEKIWKYTEKIDLPRIIFLNKMEKENVNFNKVISDLHIQFGKKVIPLTLTLGEGESFTGLIDIIDKKAYEYNGFEKREVEIPEIRQAEVDVAFEEIMEVVAESDDELMNKYFNEEPFSRQELMRGMVSAMIEGRAVPLIAGSAINGAGIDLLLDTIVSYMPLVDDERANIGFRHEDEKTRKVSPDEPFSAVVFKTIVDPFVGKISIFKVLSGAINKNDEVYNVSKEETEKMGNLFYIRGKEQIPTDQVTAGDIGAISKLNKTQTGDTLADKQDPTIYKRMKYSKPNLFWAIEADSKSDEDKISHSLARLNEEDPSFSVDRNPETNQMTLAGMGNMQLQVILDKLKSKFSVNAHRIELKIPYRETIKGKSDVQGKHKKQSGGAGQYGDVHIRYEPCDEDFIFDEEVFGGSVPKNYFPAVEKGVEETLQEGILAGYPVVNVKATLYDGSYHPVDSSEIAFKTAAQIATRKGLEEANPVLLEPVMKVNINIPDDYLGDIMGDMNKRRGKILGMEPQEDGTQVVLAEAPYSELLEYSIDLRSMTQARGSFSMDFDHYEEVPSAEADKIIEESKQ